MRVITIRRVPDNLHSRFKALCALENISIQGKVVELIQAYVEREEKKKGK
ncbi:hypothetical protein MYX64_07900 [Nitrospinae bacterium AH_259_B05_G02_I21]|nr:hypothetical protein [Nitrospinae bacterium AH_259_B05_G02_I21]